jgi:hypothetical protein
LVRKREKERGDRIRLGLPFDKRSKEPDSLSRVTPRQGDDAIRGSRLLCEYM